MREFKALNPKNLPDGFNLEIHTEEPVVEVKESAGRIIINYAFPGFYLVDDHREVAGNRMELKQIHIKSTGFFTESGKPLLPSFGRYVQIPSNCDYTRNLWTEAICDAIPLAIAATAVILEPWK